MAGAAAKGFEAVSAGAGEEVEHTRAGDALGEGGKDGGAEGVGGGAQFTTAGKLELDAAGLASGDAHERQISKDRRAWQLLAGRLAFDEGDEARIKIGEALGLGGVGGGVFPAVVEVVGLEDAGGFEPGLGAAGKVFEQGFNQGGVQLQVNNPVHNWGKFNVRF